MFNIGIRYIRCLTDDIICPSIPRSDLQQRGQLFHNSGSNEWTVQLQGEFIFILMFPKMNIYYLHTT